MNFDPDEFRDERLRHPKEKMKVRRSTSSRPGGAVPVISVVALLLAFGLTFFVYSVNEKYEIGERSWNDQVIQLMSQIKLLGEQLEGEGQRMELLGTDLETVQKRVGVTRNELKRARSVAEEIRQAQQEDVQLLTRKILTKAEVQQVDALEVGTNTKFEKVDQQITGVQQDVEASRQEQEKTWEELSSMGLRVTDQGKAHCHQWHCGGRTPSAG